MKQQINFDLLKQSDEVTEERIAEEFPYPLTKEKSFEKAYQKYLTMSQRPHFVASISSRNTKKLVRYMTIVVCLTLTIGLTFMIWNQQQRIDTKPFETTTHTQTETTMQNIEESLIVQEATSDTDASYSSIAAKTDNESPTSNYKMTIPLETETKQTESQVLPVIKNAPNTNYTTVYPFSQTTRSVNETLSATSIIVPTTENHMGYAAKTTIGFSVTSALETTVSEKIIVSTAATNPSLQTTTIPKDTSALTAPCSEYPNTFTDTSSTTEHHEQTQLSEGIILPPDTLTGFQVREGMENDVVKGWIITSLPQKDAPQDFDTLYEMAGNRFQIRSIELSEHENQSSRIYEMYDTQTALIYRVVQVLRKDFRLEVSFEQASIFTWYKGLPHSFVVGNTNNGTFLRFWDDGDYIMYYRDVNAEQQLTEEVINDNFIINSFQKINRDIVKEDDSE